MTLKKHSVELFGHKTSLALEDEFWQALQKIAVQKNTSISALIKEIDARRTGPLSSAVRVFVLNYFVR